MLSDKFISAGSRTYPSPQGVQAILVLRAGDTTCYRAGNTISWVIDGLSVLVQNRGHGQNRDTCTVYEIALLLAEEGIELN
jgi:hypothetical protein